MDKDKSTISLDSLTAKRKRIKRIKIWIIIIVVILLILPTMLSIIMFFKVNSLQKQVDILMTDRYGVTYNDRNNKHHEIIAHAAVTDNGVIEEDINQNDYDYVDSFNQSEENDSSDLHNEIGENESSITDTEVVTEDKLEQAETLPQKDDENKVFSKKKVYLTFDDGPSQYTDDILDILSDYNVKATFFVIGKTDKYSKKMYRRIVEEGHTLGMHSYSHDYKNIYKSVEDFDKDFTKLSDLLYDTTGYRPSIYRFPGGSSNNVSNLDITDFIKYLNKKSIIYYDWNVVNGDATGKILTPEELSQNVITGVDLHKTSIVLMHDTVTKENTVKSLTQILQTLIEGDATILPLDKDVAPIQQVKASSLKK